MGTEEDKKKYTEFKEKVKRTVYMDNLSPAVTEPILKSALNQFGDVKNIQLITNHKETKNIPQCALIEMEDATHAKSIVADITAFPFMISGMPRPVRAFPAEEEMFLDRPRNISRPKIQVRWVERGSKEMKSLTEKLNADCSALLEVQLEEEGKLDEKQREVLRANHTKFEMMKRLKSNGTFDKLSKRLQLNIDDTY